MTGDRIDEGPGGASPPLPGAERAPALRDRAEMAYGGDPRKVFSIAIGGTLLTFATLGLYRFWLKTRLRRYHWAHFKVADDAFEYHGRPLELMIGALTAIVILSVYLVIAAATLNFVVLSAYGEQAFGYGALAVAAGLPLAPLWPYAAYRAQRYLLSRLSWRGIRLRLELAAWSYAGRSLLWFLANLLSGFLLKPLADYHLRRFLVRRMRFGDAPFEQGGTPGELYRGYAPTLALLLLALLLALGDAIVWPFVLLGAGVAYVWYTSFRDVFFLKHLRIGTTGIETKLTPGALFGLYFGALFASGLVVGVLGGALKFVGFAIVDDLVRIGSEEALLVLGALSAVVTVALYRACWEAFYHTRVLRAVAETSAVADIAALEGARQARGEGDDEAEGFADALDVGAF